MVQPIHGGPHRRAVSSRKGAQAQCGSNSTQRRSDAWRTLTRTSANNYEFDSILSVCFFLDSFLLRLFFYPAPLNPPPPITTNTLSAAPLNTPPVTTKTFSTISPTSTSTSATSSLSRQASFLEKWLATIPSSHTVPSTQSQKDVDRHCIFVAPTQPPLPRGHLALFFIPEILLF